MQPIKIHGDLKIVRAGFVLQGTTMNIFCIRNGIDRRNAHKALVGKWSGVKGRELRNRLIDAARGEE